LPGEETKRGLVAHAQTHITLLEMLIDAIAKPHDFLPIRVAERILLPVNEMLLGENKGLSGGRSDRSFDA
jgi:hypothetical protein